MEYYAGERRKELQPFRTAWMELESIMVSEVSQAAKDKYHMISPISGTLSTNYISEQNRTRDREIKNKLTVTRGEQGRGVTGKGHEGACIKGPWTKTMWQGVGLNVGSRVGRVEESDGRVQNGDNCN